MNRYLVSSTGRYLRSRLAPGFLLLAIFAVPFVVGGVVGMTAWRLDPVALAIVGVAIGGALLLAGPCLFFWGLSRARGHLSRGNAAWLRGDSAEAVRSAHFVLTWVFRSDFRTAAFHLLGLTAEGDGEFALAHELFSMAKDAMPLMAPSRIKDKLHAVLEAHLAFTASALGRPDLAQVAIARGWHQVQLTQLPSDISEVLFGEALLPMPGFMSVVSNMSLIEDRRDPRGLLFLSGTLAALRSGEARMAADVGAMMHAWLRTLLPREALLFQMAMARVLAALDGGGGGGHGAGSVPSLDGNPMRAWVERALGH